MKKEIKRQGRSLMFFFFLMFYETECGGKDLERRLKRDVLYASASLSVNCGHSYWKKLEDVPLLLLSCLKAANKPQLMC